MQTIKKLKAKYDKQTIMFIEKEAKATRNSTIGYLFVQWVSCLAHGYLMNVIARKIVKRAGQPGYALNMGLNNIGVKHGYKKR